MTDGMHLLYCALHICDLIQSKCAFSLCDVLCYVFIIYEYALIIRFMTEILSMEFPYRDDFTGKYTFLFCKILHVMHLN